MNEPHPATSLIGTSLMTFSMDVERGKVREFARATGAGVEAYEVPDAVVPPTFLATSALWEPDSVPSVVEQIGVDLTRVLQGGQEYSFGRRKPQIGDRLDVGIEVESVDSKLGRHGGSMTFIVLLTTYRLGDEVVAEGRATVIERSVA